MTGQGKTQTLLGAGPQFGIGRRLMAHRRSPDSPPAAANRLAQVGSETERLAGAYLQSNGLHLLACNYRCRRGEIDLV